MSLESFFAAIGPFLRGENSVQLVQNTLGPSPSGSEALGFYPTLIGRNYAKILREVYVSVRAAAMQSDEHLWPALVREYSARTQVTSPDPNEFGREFSDWLVARRELEPQQPALLEELADYQWIRHLARNAAESEGGLGLEHRLFIRHYTHAVPKLAAALWKGEDVDINAAQPTSVLVYREFGGSKLRNLYPNAMALGLLVELATGTWPESLRALDSDEDAKRVARLALVEAKVLGSP